MSVIGNAVNRLIDIVEYTILNGIYMVVILS